MSSDALSQVLSIASYGTADARASQRPQERPNHLPAHPDRSRSGTMRGEPAASVSTDRCHSTQRRRRPTRKITPARARSSTPKVMGTTDAAASSEDVDRAADRTPHPSSTAAMTATNPAITTALFTGPSYRHMSNGQPGQVWAIRRLMWSGQTSSTEWTISRTKQTRSPGGSTRPGQNPISAAGPVLPPYPSTRVSAPLEMRARLLGR